MSKKVDSQFSKEALDALAALKRAAKRAREVAIQHGTDIAVWKGGRTVFLDPKTGLEKKDSA
jgi:hypothetical protein